MFHHVNGIYNGTHYTVTVVKGKGPVADWTRETLESVQDLAKFACRMALIYGYTVTLDLGPGTDDLLKFYPGDAFRSDTLDFPIGAFHWQSKEV